MDLKPHNTLGLPGRAAHWVEIRSVDDIQTLIAQGDAAQTDVHIWGGGSNVVLLGDVPGLVMHMAITGRRWVGSSATHHLLEAGAGENWHAFVQWTLNQGYPGLENLALIPGTVGAAPVQNIGAYGLELGERLHSVQGVDLDTGQLFNLPANACQLGYRHSIFKEAQGRRWAITHVRFALPIHWQPVLTYGPLQALADSLVGLSSPLAQAQSIYETVCDIRRRKLPNPAIQGNVGSFFKNPLVSATDLLRLRGTCSDLVYYPLPSGQAKLAAAWLIEQCGWKGYRAGAVGVHRDQALVLVNEGGARGLDVLYLARAIKDSVLARFGVALQMEPLVWGKR
jgi:UDP-N-acetylmuramate dehydrogenase